MHICPQEIMALAMLLSFAGIAWARWKTKVRTWRGKS